MLTQEYYKKNATRLQEAIHRAGGVSRAADIIEQAVSTGKPVLAQESIFTDIEVESPRLLSVE